MRKDTELKYMKFLSTVFEDCQRHGSIKTMSLYSSMCGVNVNVGSVLQKLGIVTKKQNGYVWNMRQPDGAMVIEVVDNLNDYIKNSRSFQTQQEPIISKKILKTTLDDVLDAFVMLPDSLTKEERKKIAKKMAEWKNS